MKVYTHTERRVLMVCIGLCKPRLVVRFLFTLFTVLLWSPGLLTLIDTVNVYFLSLSLLLRRLWVNYTWKRRKRKKPKCTRRRRRRSLWGPTMTVTPTVERSLPRETGVRVHRKTTGRKKKRGRKRERSRWRERSVEKCYNRDENFPNRKKQKTK